MLRDLQSAFRRGMLGGDTDRLRGVIAGDAIAAAHRLAIHRNNILGSLADVLQAAYPVAQRLMGAGAFRRATLAYIRRHPPLLPQLSAYGDRFAGFLADFVPARAMPALPDIARLEWARLEAYFAADATPLAPTALAAVPPEHVPAIRFVLHPSVRLVSSRWPVDRIWRANQPGQADDEQAGAAAGGERVLVARPALAVRQRTLGTGNDTLLRTMRAGATLGDAAGAALAAEPGFDLQRALLEHLSFGVFTGFSIHRAKGDEP